jgi:hypothetical protein
VFSLLPLYVTPNNKYFFFGLLEYYEANALSIFMKVNSKQMIKFVHMISDFKINGKQSYMVYYNKTEVKVKLSLYLTNKLLRHEGVWGSGYLDPHFLDVGTSWRRMISFTPPPLCSR